MFKMKFLATTIKPPTHSSGSPPIPYTRREPPPPASNINRVNIMVTSKREPRFNIISGLAYRYSIEKRWRWRLPIIITQYLLGQ